MASHSEAFGHVTTGRRGDEARSATMACLQKLKEDIRLLEALFVSNHERFQVVSASVDEISVRFIGPNGNKINISANIMVRDYSFFRAVVSMATLFLFFPRCKLLSCPFTTLFVSVFNH